MLYNLIFGNLLERHKFKNYIIVDKCSKQKLFMLKSNYREIYGSVGIISKGMALYLRRQRPARLFGHVTEK